MFQELPWPQAVWQGDHKKDTNTEKRRDEMDRKNGRETEKSLSEILASGLTTAFSSP